MFRKAQGAEYIGIVLLIILLVLFVLFTRLSSVSETATRTEKSVVEYKVVYNVMSHSVFPYLTVNKIPLLELFSYYTCFKDERADYNFGQVQVIQSVQKKFDALFGKDKWMLELNGEICIATDSVRLTRCYIGPDEKLELIPVQYPLFCRPEVNRGLLVIRI